MSNNVLISVIMTNYNYGHYIGYTIDAVIKQDEFIHEYLITDDCSTDNSLEIISRKALHCTKIKIFINKINLGCNICVNALQSMVTGNYIFPQSSDDFVLPGFFKSVKQLFNQYPEAALCCGDPVFLYVDSGQQIVQKLNLRDTPGYLSPSEIVTKLSGGIIPGHCSVFRASVFNSCGGFNERLKWHYDWFLTLVLAFRFGICYFPSPAAVMRVHSNSYSTGHKDKAQQLLVVKEIIKLLQSSTYADIYPSFVKSKALNFLGSSLVHTLIFNPHYWDKFTLMILFNYYSPYIKNFLFPYMPVFCIQVYRHLKRLLFS